MMGGNRREGEEAGKAPLPMNGLQLPMDNAQPTGGSPQPAGAAWPPADGMQPVGTAWPPAQGAPQPAGAAWPPAHAMPQPQDNAQPAGSAWTPADVTQPTDGAWAPADSAQQPAAGGAPASPSGLSPAGAGPASYEYCTFPRAFVTYKWYKPLLVAVLAFMFLMIFQVVLFAAGISATGSADFLSNIGEGYDSMNPYDAASALASFGGIAVMLPALALALLVVRDRPFASLSSSRGGWNWHAFLKCLAVAVAVMGCLIAAEFALSSDEASGVVQFTVAGFIAVTLLVPLQCVAEEYLFRGFIMQTVGAWTKAPLVAIVVQAAEFTAMHPYNAVGMAAIFLGAAVSGVVTWQTKGLEASCAMHIVNNLVAFYLGGFGLSGITSEIDMLAFVTSVSVEIAFAVIVLLAGKRFNWFAAQGDTAAAFNAKAMAKRHLPQHPQTFI